VARCALRRSPELLGPFTAAFCSLRRWPAYGYLFALDLVDAGASSDLFEMLMSLPPQALDRCINGKPQVVELLSGLLPRLSHGSVELLATRVIDSDVAPGPAVNILVSCARTSLRLDTPTTRRDGSLLCRSVMTAGH
jgi:hypothetical protein